MKDSKILLEKFIDKYLEELMIHNNNKYLLDNKVYRIIYQNIYYGLSDKIGTYLIECLDDEENYENILIQFMKKNENFCIVINRINNIINQIIFIFENFCVDKRNIEKAFGEELSEIKDVECFKGDLHNNMSVAKIILENDKVIYFKPRNSNDLDLLYRIMDITFLGKNIDFYKTCYYSKNSHSWIDEVKYVPAESILEGYNYYYRCGCILAIFYILGSYDMHFENIIRKGGNPIVIDAETLVSCENNNIIDYTKYRSVIHSVLNTSFIPFRTEESLYSGDISGALSTDFYIYNNGEMINATKFQSEKVSKRLLTLNDIKDNLIKGFEETSEIIIRERERIIKTLKEFSNKDNACFRQLLRPTIVYHKFLESSFHPEILASKQKYEELFDIFINKFTPSKYGYLRVNDEISQMKEGNIPYYFSKLDSFHLFSRTGIVCKNYYSKKPIESIVNKINNLNIDIINYQKDLIKMSVATKYIGNGYGIPSSFLDYNRNRYYTEQDVMKMVTDYLEYLYKKESPISVDKSTMLINSISNENDEFIKVDNIPLDLYGGSGILLLFAYAGKIKNEGKYIILTKKIFSYFKEIKLSLANKLNKFSVYSGLDSLAYIAYNLYCLTGDDFYSKYFDEYISNIKNEFEKVNYEKNELFYDYLNGIGSTIVFLCRVYNTTNNNIWKDNIRQFMLLVNKSIFNNKHKFCNKNDPGYAHGLSGVSVFLSALYNVVKDKRLLQEIEACICIIINLISNNNLYLKDNAWCRGITGIIAASHLIEEFSGINTKTMRENIMSTIVPDVSYDYLYSSSLCLCHGIYGNIDIFLGDNTTVLNKNFYQALFENLFEIKWFGEELNVSFDSFMLGNSGVAYELLRLYYKIPSILKLEIIKSEKIIKRVSDCYEN